MIISAFMALQEIRIGNLLLFSDKVVCTTLSECRDLRRNVFICICNRDFLFYVNDNWIIICTHDIVHVRV